MTHAVPLTMYRPMLKAALMIAMLSLPCVAQAAACPTMNRLPAGAEGSVGYDSVTKMIYFCNGTTWVPVNPS